MQLELYYYNACPFCGIVLRAIEQLGMEEKIVMKNTREHREYAQELIQMNGYSQVPCLVIDGKPMLESADINQFLYSHFGS